MEHSDGPELGSVPVLRLGAGRSQLGDVTGKKYSKENQGAAGRSGSGILDRPKSRSRYVMWKPVKGKGLESLNFLSIPLSQR